MAIYAVGDLQGCDEELGLLLEKIEFGRDDRLWLVGDLVNRGPDSLKVLRRLMALGNQCQVVLGNHDLHFLGIYFGGHSGGRSDTFDELLAAEDVDVLAHWLRGQKLVYFDVELNTVMVHAGIPHVWSIPQAVSLAEEVERVISGRDKQLDYVEFFKQMYGNKPNSWRDELSGMDRLRLITNYLTRMRFIREDGALDFASKGAVSSAPADFYPWFRLVKPSEQGAKILFGHWAALDGMTDRADIIALDTGCVWGRRLTALNVETSELHSVEAILS